MANWCRNIVLFTGEPENLKNVTAFFKDMKLKGEKNAGKLLSFVPQNNKPFFELVIDNNITWYETLNVPNLGTLKEIAEHFEVGFVCDYCESGLLVYGQARYQDNNESNVQLVPADLEAVKYDNESEAYKFEGKDYYDEWAIYKSLLERKKLANDWPGNLAGLPQPQKSPGVLYSRRIAGVLPHIDIAGTDFTIDWRLRELRDTAEPWNKLNMHELSESESGGEYLGLYDTAKKCLYTVDNDMTELPENVIGIEIPNEIGLDPVAVARENNIDVKCFVKQNPITPNLSALIRPITETGLPEMVENNLRKSQEHGDENRGRKIGR